MNTPYIRISLLAIMVFLGGIACAQTPLSRQLQVKKTILDAIEYMDCSKSYPGLETEYGLFKAKFEALQRVAGYQPSWFPLSMNPLTGETLEKTDAIAKDLVTLMEQCRKKVAALPVNREKALERHTLLSLNPGCYYLGLDESSLCDNPLHSQLEMLALQDYPFEDAAGSDECLWDVVAQSPNISHLVLFATDMTDELVEQLGFEKLTKLKVVQLSENSLTKVPSFVMKAQGLTYLNLGRNQITSMPADLKPLQSLQFLNLAGNPLPEAEKQRIKAALPKAHIII